MLLKEDDTASLAIRCYLGEDAFLPETFQTTFPVLTSSFWQAIKYSDHLLSLPLKYFLRFFAELADKLSLALQNEDLHVYAQSLQI